MEVGGWGWWGCSYWSENRENQHLNKQEEEGEGQSIGEDSDEKVIDLIQFT